MCCILTKYESLYKLHNVKETYSMGQRLFVSKQKKICKTGTYETKYVFFHGQLFTYKSTKPHSSFQCHKIIEHKTSHFADYHDQDEDFP